MFPKKSRRRRTFSTIPVCSWVPLHEKDLPVGNGADVKLAVGKAQDVAEVRHEGIIREVARNGKLRKERTRKKKGEWLFEAMGSIPN
jgi:hypothetical protein